MMIEADVNLGYFTGDSIWDLIPIMAYPPELHSDLSMDLFLDKVIEVGFLLLHYCHQWKKFYKYLY